MPRRRNFAPRHTRPVLFWEPSENLYALRCDFSEAFVSDLQMLCDTPPRYAGGQAKVWFVAEVDLDSVKATIAAHFPEHTYGKLDFIPKPDPNRKPPQSGRELNGAGKAAALMFEIGGYDQAKKVYSMLIRQFHPDSGLPTADHDKAAQITTAWRELKSHFGWS